MLMLEWIRTKECTAAKGQLIIMIIKLAEPQIPKPANHDLGYAFFAASLLEGCKDYSLSVSSTLGLTFLAIKLSKITNSFAAF